MSRPKRVKAHDEAQVNQQRNRDKVTEHHAAESLRFVMSDFRGRATISGILDICMVDEGSLVLGGDGNVDPLASAQRDGSRCVGIEIQTILKDHCPDEWLKMQAEKLEAAREDD